MAIFESGAAASCSTAEKSAPTQRLAALLSLAAPCRFLAKETVQIKAPTFPESVADAPVPHGINSQEKRVHE